MNLNETIDNMMSDQWEYRLLAEFEQTAIRFSKLNTWIAQLEAEPYDKECAYLDVFKAQAITMHLYSIALLARLLDTNLEIPKTLTDTIFKAMGANPTTQKDMRRLAYKALNLTERDNQ